MVSANDNTRSPSADLPAHVASPDNPSRSARYARIRVEHSVPWKRPKSPGSPYISRTRSGPPLISPRYPGTEPRGMCVQRPSPWGHTRGQMMKKLALILALGLTLAACAGDSGQEVSETFSEVSAGLDSDGGEAFQTTVAGAEETPAPGEFPDSDVAAERQVIRQASLELQADETREAFEDIVRLVESVGGFVSTATVHPVINEGDQPEVTMVLRVPADELRARSGCREANFSGPGADVPKHIAPEPSSVLSAGYQAPAQANLGSGLVHRPTSFPSSGPRLDNEPATGIFRSAPIAIATAGPRCAWAWATRRCFRWRPVPCPTCWPGRPPG